MRVTETMSFSQYWMDSRFTAKRPYLLGSKKLAFGDNIYFKEKGVWHQENSHHSLANGKPNPANITHDTRVDRVLVSDDFVYWGAAAPTIPPALAKNLCKRGPGHRCDFDEAFIGAVTTWLRGAGAWGYAGVPLDWSRTA
jgi:hypothetical protein